jgi:hypothetical protein
MEACTLSGSPTIGSVEGGIKNRTGQAHTSIGKGRHHAALFSHASGETKVSSCVDVGARRVPFV